MYCLFSQPSCNGFWKPPSSTIIHLIRWKKKNAGEAFIYHQFKATIISPYFLIATSYLYKPVVFITHDKFTSKEASIMTHFPFYQQLSFRPIRHKAGIFPWAPNQHQKLLKQTTDYQCEVELEAIIWCNVSIRNVKIMWREIMYGFSEVPLWFITDS